MPRGLTDVFISNFYFIWLYKPHVIDGLAVLVMI